VIFCSDFLLWNHISRIDSRSQKPLQWVNRTYE